MIYGQNGYITTSGILASICTGFGGLVLAIGIFWGLGASARVYDVWAERKVGEAELARADSNRQIRTLEAKATMESSKHLADAEIIRAKGVAEANQIIGNSLSGNEAYLRYLWVQKLGESHHQTVYIPTEAGMPILEAGKR